MHDGPGLESTLTYKQLHAEKQDINCPGCDKHFVHFSTFVRHVEFHECPVISQETAAARCQKELDFARTLERIDRMGHGVNRVKDFTVYLGGGRESPPADHLPARLATANQSSSPWPSDIEALDKSEFPEWPSHECHYASTNVPGLVTGKEINPLHGQEAKDPRASAQNHFLIALPAQNSTQEQVMHLQLLRKESDSEWQKEEKAMTRARGVVKADANDFRGRGFDPKRSFCPYTKLYKCPRCRKG